MVSKVEGQGNEGDTRTSHIVVVVVVEQSSYQQVGIIEQSSSSLPMHTLSYFPFKQMTYLNCVNKDGSRAFGDIVVGWFHFTIDQNCESCLAACESSFAGGLLIRVCWEMPAGAEGMHGGVVSQLSLSRCHCFEITAYNVQYNLYLSCCTFDSRGIRVRTLNLKRFHLDAKSNHQELLICAPLTPAARISADDRIAAALQVSSIIDSIVIYSWNQ